MPSSGTVESQTLPRMGLRSLSLLLLLAPATASSGCSCTPTKYTFRLALSHDCSSNDIADNEGIRESLCFIEEGVTLPQSSDKRDIMRGPFGGRRRSPIDVVTEDNAAEYDADGEQVRRMKRSDGRNLSATPVEVISIQYLEFDTSDTLNVVHTDDSYLSSSFVDGETFEFYSQTSLPSNEKAVGGASLILYGKNEEGEVIRNRFFWTFEDCEAALDGVQIGDAIGWVIIDEIAGPFPLNCPAVQADSPTISPRTDEPTFATQLTDGPTTVNWFSPSPSSSNGGGNGSPTPTTEGPTPINLVTPSPSSSNGGGMDDEGGTTTDDSTEVTDDNNAGSDDSNGNISESTVAPTGYYSPSIDVVPAPSPKGTTPGTPFVKAKSGGNAYQYGKTPKHPYDTWGDSYDGGEMPGKSGKNSKGGKTLGKAMKGHDVYIDNDDSLDEDDDYHAYSLRLFGKASHDGESIRR